MELDAPVQRYLPEFSGGAKALVTVRHLLSHTSGLPAGAVRMGRGLVEDDDLRAGRPVVVGSHLRLEQRGHTEDDGAQHELHHPQDPSDDQARTRTGPSDP